MQVGHFLYRLPPPSSCHFEAQFRSISRTSSFLPLPPQSRSGFTSAGLRCKVGQRGRRMGIRCETAEASREKFEYQAERYWYWNDQIRANRLLGIVAQRGTSTFLKALKEKSGTVELWNIIFPNVFMG
ncbi:uncharacterized protein LOC122026961 [Zingiber officinale]|uniref:uncharacterized protein LOC122026961 n=1 Tax=Zingiber officinale TaxID=94328 RepID=UPI001C4B749F|nr:uncharacterized protein LOC122026961 [Zingiber officinale]